jgi:hypothetical protein
MIRDRYPKADVLGQRGHWDEATRKVVLDRVHNLPSFTFFSEHERDLLEALCNRVIPQSHRPSGKRVPIAPWIDQRCAEGAIDGFRFEDMPPQEVAWRQGLAGIDEAAGELFGRGFTELSHGEQDGVLERVRRGDPPGEAWNNLPAHRFWVNIAMRQIAGVYYAHPFAWDEIGFGGPAYPRGYFALNHGAREPWEAKEA